MKKNIPIHPDCIWQETILQLWNHFINLLVEVWKLHSLYTISIVIKLIMTHLSSSFQENQLAIILHTIHFYQKDWNLQIHLHLICVSLKGIHSSKSHLIPNDKSHQLWNSLSFFLDKECYIQQKRLFPFFFFEATRYFN